MTNHKFSDLGLAEPIQRALNARNHVIPTPIQVKAIPQLLEGRDILGIAQTGTGKTGPSPYPFSINCPASTGTTAPMRRAARAP